MESRNSDALKIVILTLSASNESRGRLCLPIIQEQLIASGATSEHIDLRTLPPVWVDGRHLNKYPPIYSEVFQFIRSADAVIFVLPVYCYTASSAAKAVTEILGSSLNHKPVGFITAAGSVRSHLAVRDLMASMMFETQTICFPTSVQITRGNVVNGVLDEEIAKLLRTFAGDFAQFAAALRGYVLSRPAAK